MCNSRSDCWNVVEKQLMAGWLTRGMIEAVDAIGI